MKKVAGLILAAGKGKRMNSNGINKVALPVGNKPIVRYGVELLEKLELSPIVVVVGFAKESVENVLKNTSAVFVVQGDQLGTADAVKTGLSMIPKDVEHVLVLQGDDCAFYTKELLEDLIKKQETSGSSITFLTIDVENPFGLGRIIRNDKEEVQAIVEEKDATEKQRLIQEINPACYVFNVSFLKKYLPLVQKSSVSGEYYLTSLIDFALSNHEKIETVRKKDIIWRGVNTQEELEEANKLFV